MKDPDWKMIQDWKKHLMRSFKEEPEKKILNLYLVASHGVVDTGQQNIVVNVYDKLGRWYKRFPFEYWIRKFAKDYPNTYHVVVFACCREIYSPKRHSGCFKGPIENARAEYEAE